MYVQLFKRPPVLFLHTSRAVHTGSECSLLVCSAISCIILVRHCNTWSEGSSGSPSLLRRRGRSYNKEGVIKQAVSINQSINQPINQSIIHSFDQSINQSISQSIINQLYNVPFQYRSETVLEHLYKLQTAVVQHLQSAVEEYKSLHIGSLRNWNPTNPYLWLIL